MPSAISMLTTMAANSSVVLSERQTEGSCSTRWKVSSPTHWALDHGVPMLQLKNPSCTADSTG